MFTGIVMAVGRLRAAEPRGGDTRLVIETGQLPLAGVRVGVVQVDDGDVAAAGATQTLVLK